MNVYLDSSVLLAMSFSEPHQLKDLHSFERGIGSELVEVECFRTMDRLRVTGEYTAEEVLQARERYLKFTVGMDFIPINRRILRRAADSFPVPLGTLDAIHLASAMAWRDRYEQEPVFATHDKALAKAAVTMGFLVVGV